MSNFIYDPKAAMRTHGARISQTSVDDVLEALGSPAVQQPRRRRQKRGRRARR